MNATTELVMLIPFNGEYVALTLDQFHAAQQHAREIVPTTTAPHTSEADQVLDAEGMEKATGIPSTWFLEQARQGAIPHIRAGKYVRFRLNETLAALHIEPNNGRVARRRLKAIG